MRDKINPEYLVNNLISFQKQTGVQIFISSYSQQSSRVLRNGLSHEEFNGKIQDLIMCNTNMLNSDLKEHEKSLCNSGLQIQSILVPAEVSYAEIVKEGEDPADSSTRQFEEKTTREPNTPSSTS